MFLLYVYYGVIYNIHVLFSYLRTLNEYPRIIYKNNLLF